MQPESPYEYEVTAIYQLSAGAVESAPAMLAFRMPPVAAAPAAPGNLAAAASSSSGIGLSWSAVTWSSDTGLTPRFRYEVQRRTGSGAWALVDEVHPAASPSYQDAGLSANTGYSYRVRTVLSFGLGTPLAPVRLESEWTEPVTATTGP